MHKKEEITLLKDYKLYFDKKLGHGSFGEIYKGEEISTHKKIAIKCEIVEQNRMSLLKSEIEILKYLKGIKGVPKIYHFLYTKKYNFMIFELLGKNIDDIFNICHKKFSLETILSLGLQMINRIESIHSVHIIHRDIKPENFLIGREKRISTIYLCDFGLAKRFRNQKTGNHIPYANNKRFTGTPSFASVYTHLGCEQSRRDDLESLAYILIYLGTGTLPWKGIKTKSKLEKYSKILTKKMNTNSEELLNGLPNEFMDFLQNVRDLQFEQKPNYDNLRGILRKMNPSNVPLEQIKLDYISIFEKNRFNINNKNDIYNNDDKDNHYESKRATKSNTTNESLNNK